MDDQDNLTISEIVAGFSDASLRSSKDILFELLVNKSAENIDLFDEESLKVVFPICVKHLCSSAAHGSPLVDLCLSLLCNLTITENNCQILLDLYVIKEESGLSSLKSDFAYIIESFLNYDSQLVEQTDDDCAPDTTCNSSGSLWEVKDPWQHVAGILCNITRLEDGRRILLKQSSKFMPRLVKQIRSRNPSRRRGSVASLRTCLFENEIHWWMIHEVGVLPYIMLPIIVATPFTDMEKVGMDPMLWLNAENPSKKWEPEIDILSMLLECIILLCQKRGMREELRKKQVYPMCRNLDYLQEDEGVSNLILEIVNLLMRDEDPDAPLEVENGPIHKGSGLEIRSVESGVSGSDQIETKSLSDNDSNYLDVVD